MATMGMLAAACALYALLQGWRFAAALGFFARAGAAGTARLDEGDVTVLQPILSGDPALEQCLRENRLASPGAVFLHLVDEDDAAAQEAAAPLEGPRTRRVPCRPPRDGENPKAVKLALALPLVRTRFVAVLDDDTVLAPGALAAAATAAQAGCLVTGLPVYAGDGGAWSRLVAAFVNGSALLTYPVAARHGALKTINGMFYVARAADLRRLGGFAAIAGELTDDRAMARLYLDAGGTLVQSAVTHRIRTTVEGPRHYAALMRRWMIFANRYVRENRSPFLLLAIGLPALMPPVLLGLGALLGWQGLAVATATLLAKAVATAWLRRRHAGRPVRAAEVLLEPVADLLTPTHLLLAALRPDRFTWRSRAMRMRGGRITYE